jgi:hypothetical protein
MNYPVIRALVFTTLALAIAVRNAMNTRAGCPIAPSHVGANVPPGLGVTTRATRIRKHPTLSRWCVHVTKPRLLLWWAFVKQAAQDRIAANQAQAGDAAIVATTDETLAAAWDTATEVA